jgi:RNA polymerase subunit RPABC4/transcription elongation factor Spt4
MKILSNYDPRMGEREKLAGGLQSGSQAIETPPDPNNIRQTIANLTDQKGKLLIALGQATYLDYRKGYNINEAIVDKAREIEEIDIALHHHLKLLKELTAPKVNALQCDCGQPLSETDQFCPNCGAKVVRPLDTPQEYKNCFSCHNEIPADSQYCNVCGKMQG